MILVVATPLRSVSSGELIQKNDTRHAREKQRRSSWNLPLALPPCLTGKHKHRGGGALPGGTHPEQRGEPADGARAWQPDPVRLQRQQEGSDQLFVLFKVLKHCRSGRLESPGESMVPGSCEEKEKEQKEKMGRLCEL